MIHLFLRNETRGGMDSVMKPLLPLLIIAGIIFLIILFLIWKRGAVKAPRKTQPPKPPEPVQPVEPVKPAEPTKEGFAGSRTFKSNFRRWVGASMTFRRTHNQHYYDEYSETNLQPTQEQLNAINAMPVQKAPIASGGALSALDSAISSVPWDADNADSVQSDIVWGYVSPEASKSIFIKVYHQELLSDPDNLINYPDTPQVLYRTPLINITPVDTTMGFLIGNTDSMINNLGQSALSPGSSTASNFIFQNRSKAEREAIARENNSIRAQKVANGIPLSAEEKAQQQVYDRYNSKDVKLGSQAAMAEASIGAQILMQVGARKANAILSGIKNTMEKFIRKFLEKFLPKFFTAKVTTTTTLATMAAGGKVAAATSFGILSFLSAVIDAAALLWEVVGNMSMIAMFALQMFLPAMLDGAYAQGSTCRSGKPFDALIEDPFLYWLVSNLVPLTMVFECFGPYLCYNSDGSIRMKEPLKIPAYFSDPTLSVYKHVFPPSDQIRPDKMEYIDIKQTFNEPDKWKLTAGIWRKDCDPGTWTSSDVDMLCNVSSYVPNTYVKGSKVPTTEVKYSRVPQTHVKDTYITTYYKGLGNCNNSDDVNWGLFCTGQSCKSGYDFVAGVCWKRCDPKTQNDAGGALCRDKCDPGSEYEVLGVCWKACPEGTHDMGALCRRECGKGDLTAYPDDRAGICWSNCGGDEDIGALCRARCKKGFHDVAGVCWGDTGTYARESKIPGTTVKYTPGYIPPNDIKSLKFPVCDFGSEIMLNRMAQYYYDQSVIHAKLSDDGKQLSYEYITMIYGVIASSELSCDIACYMKTVTFDAITGDNYKETFGTTYEDDPGNNISYRRFYFIYTKDAKDSAGNAIPYEDAEGNDLFIVTGCTNADYTAPDAQVKSTDPSSNPPISVRNIYNENGEPIRINGKEIKPKIFEVTDKSRGITGYFDQNVLVNSIATTVFSQGLSYATGTAADLTGGWTGFAIDTGAQVGTGYAQTALVNLLYKANPPNPDPDTSMASKVVTVGNNSIVLTNNDTWAINFGPIYEQVARENNGFIPDFKFCEKVITSNLLCSNEYVLRDTIDAYHAQYPNVHIKTVYEIEPRGRDGCYYKWSTVKYTPETNTEDTALNTEEVIKRYVINDTSTCVFAPLYENKKHVFTTDMTNYPIRSYVDPITNLTVYPTKKVISIPTYSGRYIRIRPSIVADDKIMQISQIAVYDSTGANIAAKKRVYANSIRMGDSAPPSVITNGKLVSLTGTMNTYQSDGGSTDYIEIDLEKTHLISKVVYYGVIDCPVPSRNNGLRIQILSTQSSPVVKELVTISNTTLQTVDFTISTLSPQVPSVPFQVPLPIPPDTILTGACISRCQDKPQLDDFVSQYNATNGSGSGSDSGKNTKHILKVLRAITPNSTRCDYEVEMVAKDAAGNNIFSKELLSASVVPKNSAAGPAYARYIRIATPITTTPVALSIQQITVSDPIGNNVALGKSVKATSTDPRGANSKVIVDGIGSSTWKSTPSMNEYIDIDLGQVQPIVSIIYSGTINARVQLMNDTLNAPIDVATITTETQTITFNKCTYTFTETSAGSFIQSTTPNLEATDTSGGVFTIASIGKNIINIYNSIVNPINKLDPTTSLLSDVMAAQNTTRGILNMVGENQTLSGCPTTKCSDPSTLASIMKSYNTKNSSTEQYGRETHTMTAISKSNISSPNTCDVMFSDLYEEYDDYLYEPTTSTKELKTQRVTLQNINGCNNMTVTSAVDIDPNAAVLSDIGNISPLYTVDKIQIDCRDPTLIANIKRVLPTTSPDGIPTYKSILQSFLNGSTCEYLMSKDIDGETYDTYISAKVAANNIAETLKEYDPDTINSVTDSTGNTRYTMNSIPVSVPFLFEYDKTVPSPRVNETVRIL
jgi:hypothetical protein